MFLALPVRALQKIDVTLAQNGGSAKNLLHSAAELRFLVGSVSTTVYFAMQNDLRLHHSRTEWPFSEQLDRKWPFCARVVKY